jgi:hypothetical protein
MSNSLPPVPPMPAPKKKGWFRRNWITLTAAAVALFFGVAIGGAGSSGSTAEAAPAPTVTVQAEPVTKTETVEKEVKVEDPLCAEVATELWSMIETMNSDVAMPYNEIVTILITQMQAYVYDESEIVRATGILEDATGTVTSLTDRIEVVGPKYQECVG